MGALGGSEGNDVPLAQAPGLGRLSRPSGYAPVLQSPKPLPAGLLPFCEWGRTLVPFLYCAAAEAWAGCSTVPTLQQSAEGLRLLASAVANANRVKASKIWASVVPCAGCDLQQQRNQMNLPQSWSL